MKEILIYNMENDLARRKEEIRLSNEILPENKKLILQFLSDKSAEVSPSRVRKYAFMLLHLAPFMKKDIRKYTMSELKEFVSEINNSPKRFTKNKGKCSEWYKADMRTALKIFIKSVKGDNYNSKDYEWLKMSLPRNVKKSRVEEGQTLTIEEIEKIISGADHPRDKALISLAYETGARPSEILTLRVGNITFDEYGAVVNIQESKTRPRLIRVISAATYLRTWINMHPHKNSDKFNEAPLWSKYRTNPEDLDSIGLAGFSKILKLVSKKCGIKKRMYPYLLRHSRSTHLVQMYPDQIVKKITGHSPSSKHFEVYLHMTNQDVDQAILKRNGLLKPEDEVKRELDKPKMCWNCKIFNSNESKVCESCGFTLDMSEIASQLNEIKKVLPIVDAIKTLQAKNDRDLIEIMRRSMKK